MSGCDADHPCGAAASVAGHRSTARAVRAVPPTATGRKRQARRIHRALAERYPDAHCELDFSTRSQLLVATVLSAQTTDVG